MAKTIIRVEKNRDYTTINNTSVHDERLSWKAKGIHVFMLTRPDDWVFYNEELQKWAKDGRDSFLAGLKELQKFGYVKKIRERNEDGTFDYVTVVYEVPQEVKPPTGKPITDNPSTEKPLTENPQLLSTNKLITNTPNTNIQSTEKEKEISSPSSLIDMNYLKIKQHYENVVIYQQSNYQQAQQLSRMLDEYHDINLIAEAMNISVSRQVVSLNYINGILNAWRSDGITTYEQYQKIKAVRKDAIQPSSNGNSFKDTFGVDVGF